MISARALEMAGITQPDTDSVGVRVNGRDPARGHGANFGSYALVDSVDSDRVVKRFPKDPAGNAYKRMRIHSGGNANLAYLGIHLLLYQGPDSKQTNGSLDDWSDLIGLTDGRPSIPPIASMLRPSTA